VKFIFLEDNIGYGPANNLGFTASKGDYVLILNPDTVFVEDCITPLIKFLKSNPKTGAVTPMLVYQDGSFQYSFGLERGVLVEYLDAFYILNNFYEKIKIRKLNKLINRNLPFEVGWISGAFLLMHRDCFESVKGFSPEYKLNYEDMDLCFKLRKNGYELFYFPEYKIAHLESVSQRKEFYNFIYYRYKGRLLFVRKYFSWIHFYLLRFFHIFGLILRILFSFVIYKGVEGKQRRKAFIDSVLLYINYN
jgi:GT2 family glycosyltransferase